MIHELTPVVGKRYRLVDGTLGTEWQALMEIVRVQEAKLRQTEERIEILRLQLQTADGRPADA